jgi:hypothetical protein
VCRSIIGTVSQEPILFGTSIEAHSHCICSPHSYPDSSAQLPRLFVIPVNNELEGLFVKDRVTVIEKLSKVPRRVKVLIILVGLDMELMYLLLR